MTLPAQPTNAEQASRSIQPWLTQINEPYANQLGSFNGKGVLVGVVDSGADLNNPLLRGQVTQGYNALSGGTGLGANIVDQIGHGSNVSGILAGALSSGVNLQGVAPGASLAMAKVFGSTGSTSSNYIDAAINWLVNTAHAPIISMSLGGPAAMNQAALTNGVNKGVLFTIATGNDSAQTPDWPAAYAAQSWAKGQIIAVGAVDATSRLASFSNWCGATAADCVVAPGVSIASAYMPAANGSAQYAYMSGTSMATPMVAGEAALIKSEWNFLSAAALAQVIFRSATHLCSDGSTGAACQAEAGHADPEYGWGLINIAAALQPIGGLTGTTANGSVVALEATSFRTGAAGVGGTLASLHTTLLDGFGRGFGVVLSPAVTSLASRATPSVDLFSAFDRSVSLVQTAESGLATGAAGFVSSGSGTAVPAGDPQVPGSIRTAVAFSAAPAALGYGQQPLVHMAIAQTSAGGSTVALGLGGMSGQFFGLESSGLAPLSIAGGDSGRFNAPYFAIVENASHVGYAQNLADGYTVRLGVLTQSAPVGIQNGSLIQNDPSRRSLGALEIQKTYGTTLVVATLGTLHEGNSLLGSSGSGALGLRANPATSFISVAAAQPLWGSVSAAGMASVGRTAGFGNSAGASYLTGGTAITTEALSFGLAARNMVHKGDSLGLSFAMPTRTVSGALMATSALSQNSGTGVLDFVSQSISLRPTAIEHDIELAYTTVTGRDSRLSAALMLRQNPGQDATAPLDRVAGLRWVTSF